MTPLEQTVASWTAAHDAYEDALRSDDPDGDALDDLRERLYGAEQALDAALIAAAGEPGTSLDDLRKGIRGKIRVLEHAVVEAERRAKHGELAGAGHDEQEAIDRLQEALDLLDEPEASPSDVAQLL